MMSDKPVSNRQEYRHKHSLLRLNGNQKTAKITMSDAGKNQNINNNRWTDTIHMYHDNLINH